MVAVYLPAFPEWFSALSLALFVLAPTLVLLVIQVDQRVTWRRVLASVLAVVVIIAGCVVFAADAVILSPCAGIEKYSWEWWLLGCWSF